MVRLAGSLASAFQLISVSLALNVLSKIGCHGTAYAKWIMIRPPERIIRGAYLGRMAGAAQLKVSN